MAGAAAWRRRAVSEAPHVVVVGGGFAGLAAVEELAALPVRTTLVDACPYNTFQPLLYQVATGGLGPGDIAYPLRNLLRTHPDLDFRRGEVTGVDLAGKRVLFAAGTSPPLEYDFLVLATGASTNWFGVPGAAEHALPIYTLDDALAVRSRVFGQLERADAAGGGNDGALTVVVVGGGATGVETAGALAELRAMALAKTYRSIDPGTARVVLVERLDRLVAAFDERLGAYTLAELEHRGVEVMLGTAVAEVGDAYVELTEASGGARHRLPCGLVVWAAGVGPGALTGALDVPRGAGGRVAVDEHLVVTGHEEVFAVGDVAAITGGDGRPLPQLAQPAIQAGRHAARQLGRLLDGVPLEPFSYRDKGIMATIGRHAAVAEIRTPAAPGHALRLHGTPAWAAWLALHLVTLLGARNRAAVLLNWSWRYIAWKRGPRVIVGG